MFSRRNRHWSAPGTSNRSCWGCRFPAPWRKPPSTSSSRSFCAAPKAQALALARLHSLQALYTAFPDAVLIARKEDTSCTDTTLEYIAVYTLEADICTQNDPGS